MIIDVAPPIEIIKDVGPGLGGLLLIVGISVLVALFFIIFFAIRKKKKAKKQSEE